LQRQPAAAPWLPSDLAALQGHIRRAARELCAADVCASSVPTGLTDGELAIELAAPQVQCQLAYTREPGEAEQAARLVPFVQRLLAEHERCRCDAERQLDELPPLLSRLTAHGGAMLHHLGQLPPALALALMALPGRAGAPLRRAGSWQRQGVGRVRRYSAAGQVREGGPSGTRRQAKYVRAGHQVARHSQATRPATSAC